MKTRWRGGGILSGSASTLTDVFSVSYAAPVDEEVTETVDATVDNDLTRRIQVTTDSAIRDSAPPQTGTQYRFGNGTSSITLKDDGTVAFEKNVPNPTAGDKKSGDAMRRQLWTVNRVTTRTYTLTSVYDPTKMLSFNDRTGRLAVIDSKSVSTANAPFLGATSSRQLYIQTATSRNVLNGVNGTGRTGSGNITVYQKASRAMETGKHVKEGAATTKLTQTFAITNTRTEPAAPEPAYAITAQLKDGKTGEVVKAGVTFELTGSNGTKLEAAADPTTGIATFSAGLTKAETYAVALKAVPAPYSAETEQIASENAAADKSGISFASGDATRALTYTITPADPGTDPGTDPEPGTVELKVKAIWSDAALMGSSSQIQLVQTNTKTGEVKKGTQLGADAVWNVSYSASPQAHTFTALPKADAQGNAYSYSIAGTGAGDFTATAKQNAENDYTVTFNKTATTGKHTITAKLTDADSKNPIIEGVKFVLTDDLGNKRYAVPDAKTGIATFDGLSRDRTYSVHLAEVPREYADSGMIESNNTTASNNNINFAKLQGSPSYDTNFVLKKSTQYISFNVYERNDSSIKIANARFKLYYESPYLTTPIVIDMVSDATGTLFEADVTYDDYGNAVYTPSTRRVALPNGPYRIEQLTSDNLHLKMEKPLSFTVVGRPDNYSIENALIDPTVPTVSVYVEKVWADAFPSTTIAKIDLVQYNPTTGDRKVGSEITVPRGSVTTSGFPYSTKTVSKTFANLRNYDDQGNRYHYSIQESMGEGAGGYYAVVDQLGTDPADPSRGLVETTRYRVANFQGYQAGTAAKGALWASDSSHAYLIGTNPRTGRQEVTGTLTIGSSTGSSYLFGHGIAYDSANDVLWGVSNNRKLIMVKDAKARAERSEAVVSPDEIIYETRAKWIKFYGEQFTNVNRAVHSLGITNDGRYLMIQSETANALYMIPLSELTNIMNAQGNGSKSIYIDGIRGVRSMLYSPERTLIKDDGDVVQLPNGDIIFTGRENPNGTKGDSIIYLLKYDAAKDNWGYAQPVGKIPQQYNMGSTHAGTAEGITYFDGKVWFTGTLDQGKTFKLFPLAEVPSTRHGITYSYPVDTAGAIDISAKPQSNGALTFSDMASSPPSTASQWVGTNVSKVWIGDTEAVRPKSITATLYTRTESGGRRTEVPAKDANGRGVQRQLTAETNWMATIKAEDMILPKYDANGREIWYVWREDAVPSGYEGSVDDGGHVITNVYHPSFQLPNTGGSGIDAFTTSGFVLMAGTLLYWFGGPRRRRRFKEP